MIKKLHLFWVLVIAFTSSNFLSAQTLTVSESQLQFDVACIGQTPAAPVLSYQLTGSDLTSTQITISSDGTDFLVSTDENGTFEQSITVDVNSGSIDITVYVQFASYNEAANDFINEIQNEAIDDNITKNVLVDGRTVEPPVITTGLDPTTELCEGDDLSLEVTATGTNLQYSWDTAGVDLGVTTNTYSKTGVTTNDNGVYTCTITTDGNCPVTTSTTVNVNTAPVVTIPLEDISVCEGSSFTLSAGIEGENLAYQWQKDGVDIPGATNPYYEVVDITENATYTLNCRNACGTVSTESNITILTNPSVSMKSEDTTICEGEDFVLDVAASGSGISIQWQKDGEDISGATEETYSKTDVTASDAGVYTCVVTGTCGTAQASVTVNINSVPQIVPPLDNASVCEGETLTLTAEAQGGDLEYQWSFNNSDISGATSNTLTIDNVTKDNEGTYICTVSNSCGSTQGTSNVLINTLPTIATQPQSVTANVGDEVTFSIEVAKAPVYTLQWQKDGTDINGANDATYTISSVTTDDAGVYTCVVTNDCGSVTSDEATLTVESGEVTAAENIDGIKVYPNPTNTGLVNIVVPDKANISVYNLQGKQVFTREATKNLQINLDAKGVYFIKVNGENYSKVFKVIVK